MISCSNNNKINTYPLLNNGNINSVFYRSEAAKSAVPD